MPVIEIDPEIAADIAKFEVMLAKHLANELEDDVFRVFRLNNGIYGQRQGGTNQMVRVKSPYGKLTADPTPIAKIVTNRKAASTLVDKVGFDN